MVQPWIMFCLILSLVISTNQAMLVCPGDNLTLTCHTNGTELRWSITFPYHYLPEIRIISSIGPVDSQTPLFENPTLFQFLRTSRAPLMSAMLIDNITAILNRTRIDCWFDEGWSTTIIVVVGNAFQTVVEVELEQFESKNVTVTLTWVQGDNEFYNASIIPYVPILFTGSTTIQLTLQYNILYSISIVAFLCEYNTTDVVELHYVNCGRPLATSTVQIDYNSTLVHSVLQFRCKDGLLPTNVFTSTCLKNGTWSPSPATHICATSSERTAVIAAIASVAVCALISLLFFIYIGYICGRKHRQEATSLDTTPQLSQPNPVYEEVLPFSIPASINQIDLNDNVAYDPLK